MQDPFLLDHGEAPQYRLLKGRVEPVVAEPACSLEG